jgi:hypothetical protein
MFDAAFFQKVFPEHVRAECQAQPDRVPVVELHLADGTKLDLCHVVFLADSWLAVAYYRGGHGETELDTAFLPYGVIARVTISLHPRSSRRVGFVVQTEQAQTHEEV